MSIRVILADDHQIVREGLRLILSGQADVEIVAEASSGREAIEQARELCPDVVVMDIAMPDLNGMEATRRITVEDPNVRVVALSAYADRRYVLGVLDAGAHGYVLKANAGEELVRAVRAAVEGKTYLTPEVAETVVDSYNRRLFPTDVGPEAELGAREREVLQLVAEGWSSAEAAEKLDISARTVEAHRRNIMKKLNLHSVAELTKYAVRTGLSSLET